MRKIVLSEQNSRLPTADFAANADGRESADSPFSGCRLPSPSGGFRIAKIRRKNSLPMHAVLSFPDSILYLFVRNPVFFDGKVLEKGAGLFVSK